MSDSITISGNVETVLPLQEFPSGFSKRVLVINTGGDYPQTIPVEFTKDKTSLLDGLSEGQEVTAFVNLRGNEYNGKYYANIQGWKLDADTASSAPAQEPAAATTHDLAGQDDIPF